MDIKKSVVRVVRSDMFVPLAGLAGACVGGIATIIAVKAMDRAVWGAVPRTVQFAAGYGGATIGRVAGTTLASIAQIMVDTGELLGEIRMAEKARAEARPS